MESWRSNATRAFGSKNHVMFGTASAFFFEHVVGLRQETRAGREAVLVAPQPHLIRDHLTGASAQQQFEGGRVTAAWSWAVGEQQWHLNVSVAPGLEATTRLHCHARGTIMEGSTVLWQHNSFVAGVDGVTRAAAVRDAVEISHGSGSYSFHIAL